MSSELQKLIDLMEGYSQGLLEQRAVNFQKGSQEKDLADHLNNLIDKVETFFREALISLEGHAEDRTFRIDSRGFDGVFLDTLEKFNQALDVSAYEKHKIQAMLESLGQGIFIFDSKGKIEDGFSKACSDIFGQDLKGKTFFEILKLEQTQASSVQEWIDIIYQEMLDFDDLALAGPSQFHKNQDKHIELEYKAVRGADGKISKIVCIATDKTQEILMKEKAESDAAYVKSITTLLKDKNSFMDFKEEFSSNIELVKKELSVKDPDINSIFRAMHSIKGGAATFGLLDIQKLAHSLEDDFSAIRDLDIELREAELESQINRFHQEINELTSLLESFLKENESIIGSTSERTKEVSVDALENFLVTNLSSSEQEKAREAFTQEFIFESLTETFKQYNKAIEQVCETLNKEARLEVEESDFRYPISKIKPLLGALVHAFRNAVDHGLEDPDEREMLDKPREGLVKVSFSKKDDRIKISISDDGGGIDPKKIAVLAYKKGLILKDEIASKTKEELIQYVLKPNFSSKEEVSEVSGRGVGLDAIKYEASKLGGNAWLQSELGMGTTLMITLPVVEAKDFI